VLSESFLCCIAEQPLGSGVPAGDYTIQVLADNRVIRRFHDSGKQKLGIFRMEIVGTCWTWF
jgi:hypothetical protein